MRSQIQYRVLCFVTALLLLASAARAEDRARELIDQAWQKIAAGEFHEARGKFDLAANIATDFSVKAEAAAWRGFASNRIGATKVAEEDFAEAEEFARQAGKDVNKALVFVLRARARSVSHLDHQLPLAAQHLTAAATLTPADQTLQLELSAVLRRNSKAREALRVLQTAAKLGPVTNELRRERANALLAAGSHAEALPDFDHLIQQGAFWGDRCQRGACYLALGDLTRAAADLDAAIKIVPDPTALRLRANVHEKQNELTEASAIWGRLARHFPADAGIAYNYGRVLHLAGRHEEAHHALSGACYLKKDFVEAKQLDAAAVAARASQDKRIREINAALQKQPADADLLLARYRRLLALSAEESAVADLETVLKNNPRHGTALWLRGRTKVAEGKHAEAFLDLRQATQSDPQRLLFAQEYFKCLSQLGRNEEADQVRQRVLKLTAPTTAEEYEAYAHDYRTDKNWAGAFQQLERAIALEPKNPWYHYLRGRYARLSAEPKFLEGAHKPLYDALHLQETEQGDRLLTAQIKYEIGKVYYSLALNVQFQLPVTGRGPGSVPNGGLLPAAIKHISEALDIEPHSFEYYADRGLCHYGRSDWAKADADFKVYLTANPNKLDYLKQRIAWWTDLHRRWDASNEQMVRQLEEFNRWHRWYLDNSDYCSACDRRVMKGESHSHN